MTVALTLEQGGGMREPVTSAVDGPTESNGE